jgi:hypothetical protein
MGTEACSAIAPPGQEGRLAHLFVTELLPHVA